METAFTTSLHVVQLIVEVLGFLVIIFRGGLEIIGRLDNVERTLKQYKEEHQRLVDQVIELRIMLVDKKSHER